jgi:hypothetical protein
MKVRAAVDLDDKSGYRMPNGIRYSETEVYEEGELMREPNWIPEGGAVAVTFEPRYVVRGKFANMKIGFVARYVNNGAWNQNYLAITPSFEANFNVARGVFVPFLSYTSQIVDGSSEALSRRNPYVYPGYSAPTGWINDARAGFAGDLGDVFSYRISGGMSLLNDYHVLTAVQEIITRQPTAEPADNGGTIVEGQEPVADNNIDAEYLPVWFEPRTTDGARFTLGAEFGVRGIGGFSGRLYANWNKFDFSGVWKSKPDPDGGMPDPVGDMSPWDGGLEVVYNHRKMLNVRLDAHLIGTRQYNITYIVQNRTANGLVREDMPGKGRIKPVLDLSFGADYEVLTNFWIFIEGHNLTGMKLYPYPTYRGTGASLIAGIKLVF